MCGKKIFLFTEGNGQMMNTVVNDIHQEASSFVA